MGEGSDVRLLKKVCGTLTGSSINKIKIAQFWLLVLIICF